MKIEEFYTVIRRDIDPVDFSTIKQEAPGSHYSEKEVYYSESEDKVVDNGTAYYLNVFKKHGNKGFFWSWNWAAFLVPTTFSFYRKIYLFWGLKWVIFLISAIFIGSVCEANTDAYKVMLWTIYILQKIFFASVANSLYLRKITKMLLLNKRYRLTPSTTAGWCGLLLIPGLY